MAEPATTTATLVADAIRLPVVAITGTVLGMYYDALLFGFVAALLTLLMMPPAPLPSILSMVGAQASTARRSSAG